MSVLKDQHNPATSTYAPLPYPAETYYNTYWFAQTFIASSSYSIHSVALRLAKNLVGRSPTVTVSIRAVTGHVPTGADLTSATKSFDSLPTANALAEHYGANPWTMFVFDSPVALTSGTEYAIVLRSSSHGSVYWTQKAAGETGYFCYSSTGGVSWSNTDSRDFSL